MKQYVRSNAVPAVDHAFSSVGCSRPSSQERLRDGSYQSIELNTKTAIPEWGGQKIYVMAEDDAYLTPDGYKLFQPRQTEFYLITSK